MITIGAILGVIILVYGVCFGALAFELYGLFMDIINHKRMPKAVKVILVSLIVIGVFILLGAVFC